MGDKRRDRKAERFVEVFLDVTVLVRFYLHGFVCDQRHGLEYVKKHDGMCSKRVG